MKRLIDQIIQLVPTRRTFGGAKVSRRGFPAALGYVRALRRAMAAKSPVRHIELIGDLLVADLELPEKIDGGLMPKRFQEKLHIAVHQRLYEVYRDKLYSEFMFALYGKYEREKILALPLPKPWRRWLVNKGVSFKEFKSTRQWWALLVTNYFVPGLRRYLRLLIDSSRVRDAKGPHAIIVNAFNGTLPIGSGPEADNHRGLATWYLSSDIRLPDEQVFAQLNGALPTDLPENLGAVDRVLPGLPDTKAKVKFAIEGSRILFFALMYLLMGRWWNIVLLRDAIELAYFKRVRKSDIASTYCFLDPYFCRRPLWTFAAEEAGSRVMLLLYSLNYQAIQVQQYDPPPKTPGWNLSNWPMYVVWEKGQADFIKQSVLGNPTVVETGTIDLQDNGKELPAEISASKEPVIAVFDVAVYRPFTLASIGWPPSYYQDWRLDEFFNQVYETVTAAGFRIAFKQKRQNPFASKHYQRTVADFQTRPGVTLVDPGISASRLIEECCGAISLPFTSTAFIAAEQKKPSTYFDPSGDIICEGNVRHGVPIINNRRALEKWVESVGNKTAQSAQQLQQNKK